MKKTYTEITIHKKLKMVNKKGTFRKCEQCDTCAYKGWAFYGIDNSGKDLTCDRDVTTCRERVGTTDKPCKHYRSVVS